MPDLYKVTKWQSIQFAVPLIVYQLGVWNLLKMQGRLDSVPSWCQQEDFP